MRPLFFGATLSFLERDDEKEGEGVRGFSMASIRDWEMRDGREEGGLSQNVGLGFLSWCSLWCMEEER